MIDGRGREIRNQLQLLPPKYAGHNNIIVPRISATTTTTSSVWEMAAPLINYLRWMDSRNCHGGEIEREAAKEQVGSERLMASDRGMNAARIIYNYQ